jgi:hypothetical protein
VLIMTLKHTVLSIWGKLTHDHNGHSPKSLHFTKEQAQRLWNASIRELSRGVDYHDNKVIAAALLKDYAAYCGFTQGSIDKAAEIGSTVLDCNRFRLYVLSGNTAYAAQYKAAASSLGAPESEIAEILAAGAMKAGEEVAAQISKGHIELEGRLEQLVGMGFPRGYADAALIEGRSHPVKTPTAAEIVRAYNSKPDYAVRSKALAIRFF